jgi:hypothetical protein
MKTYCTHTHTHTFSHVVVVYYVTLEMKVCKWLLNAELRLTYLVTFEY